MRAATSIVLFCSVVYTLGIEQDLELPQVKCTTQPPIDENRVLYIPVNGYATFICERETQPPRTKIRFNVSSSSSSFKSNFRVLARIDRIPIPFERKYEKEGMPISVIYNTCTSSDQPEMACKEVQVTFWTVNVTNETLPVSFHLYQEEGNDITHYRELYNDSLELLPYTVTRNPPPTDETGSTNIDNGPGITDTIETACTANLLYRTGLIVVSVLAGLLLVLFLATAGILIAYKATRPKKQKGDNADANP